MNTFFLSSKFGNWIKISSDEYNSLLNGTDNPKEKIKDELRNEDSDQGKRLASLMVTERCNLDCSFCYVHNSRVNVEPDTQTLKEYIEALTFCDYLKITGGEPLLRDDLIELIEYSIERFQKVEVNTNGTLLDKEICERLGDLECSVQVSLDGANSETHNDIRGGETFKETLEGIRYLKKYNEKLKINTTINSLNYEEASSIAGLA